MNDITKLKSKLLYNLAINAIYVTSENGYKQHITQTLPPIIYKIHTDIKVTKRELDRVNEFWKILKNSLENCIDADDMINFIDITNYYSAINKDIFWRTFNELKSIYDIKSNNVSSKPKIKIDPRYGRHVNKYNQNQ